MHPRLCFSGCELEGHGNGTKFYSLQLICDVLYKMQALRWPNVGMGGVETVLGPKPAFGLQTELVLDFYFNPLAVFLISA